MCVRACWYCCSCRCLLHYSHSTIFQRQLTLVYDTFDCRYILFRVLFLLLSRRQRRWLLFLPLFCNICKRDDGVDVFVPCTIYRNKLHTTHQTSNENESNDGFSRCPKYFCSIELMNINRSHGMSSNGLARANILPTDISTNWIILCPRIACDSM